MITPSAFLESAGYLGLFAIVFAETSVGLGLLLPGDSLLLSAGLLAHFGYFNLYKLLAITFLAAVLGDSFGYLAGKKLGPKLFAKEEAKIFKPQYLLWARDFFNRHGGKTLTFARFVPILRTAAPLLSGAGQMPVKTFLAFNLLGAVLWTASLILLGKFLGSRIPQIEKYLLPAVLTLLLLPAVYQLARWRQRKP